MLRRVLIATLVLTALAGCTPSATPTPDVVPVAQPVEFVVGDCIDNSEVDGEKFSDAVDCSEPHDSEAFADITLPDGDYPGQPAIYEEAVTGCESAFYGFVGVLYNESTIGVTYYYPTSERWAAGDRTILCLAQDAADGEFIESTGSLEGAAR